MDSLVAVRGLQKFQHVGTLVMTRGFSRPAACRILVPQLGIEPASPAMHGGLLTTDWTTREVSPPCFLWLLAAVCLKQGVQPQWALNSQIQASPFPLPCPDLAPPPSQHDLGQVTYGPRASVSISIKQESPGSLLVQAVCGFKYIPGFSTVF